MIISLLFSAVSFGTEVKLTSFNRYGATPSMELALSPSNANSLEEVFSVIKISRKELYVRLIGESSKNTNSELFNFYSDKFPYWKGDLTKEPHLVKPLFVDALKSTTLYKTLNRLLKENGYHINNISFEKLSFDSNSISVPDVYIECAKST
ncbi:hypothetical protein J8M20_03095 [Pseudoalteromonas luteoviolacea]|uniref:hypothetical protein n=1 Tax=Pseudoalteromonas luteoviolacea TaxID=43657 RepID=UPI001B384BC2|nr:hypothetical protein [Pseudoalteromonas luteoviolacea]MBQ4810301.1 hypothetical protein [Pseudoalteromonas luteoviolacea]